ncbi:Oligosaccharide translocation protein rft1 [Vanrija albida]|uniref:Man(5)GlcNAc(2)-PP-dolichol translocation protein RFT1 n=1 Tax=Vanrija albida TaxID=181172 RepID=A0ABR3PST7_9TREE
MTADTPAPPAASPTALARALILLQLLSRLLTFGLNQVLVRLAPPSVFGTAAIQFDLVAATVLFLSREGVRNALLRGGQPAASDDKTGKAAGTLSPPDAALAALPLRLGALVAAAAVSLYLYTAPASTTSQAGFYPALSLYVAAALAELLVEPAYVRALRAGDIRTRVQAEGGMAIVRAVVACACLVADRSGTHALLGFAAGHFAGAAWLAARYLWAYGAPTLLPSSSYDPATYALALANTRQSVVKHVLTEADRIAVGYISPLGDQGGYAVAMNYGSLVARIIFQPLEETLLLHWSRSLDAPATVPLLTLALRLSSHLALLLPVFVPPLLPLLLPFLLPRRYTAETSAALTLQTYLACYLPLLSLNGILEAFHAASATPAQVARQAKVMVASSGVFALSLWALARGTIATVTTEQALIYASCTAMLVRIGYALVHARSVVRQRQPASAFLRIGSVLPKWPIRIAVAVLGGVVWAASARLGGNDDNAGPSLRNQVLLLALGAGAGAIVLGLIFVMEKAAIAAVGRALKGKAD